MRSKGASAWPLFGPGIFQTEARIAAANAPDGKAEPKPEANAEPEAKAKTPSDLTPQIVKRANEPA
jgi:hypothetical protein